MLLITITIKKIKEIFFQTSFFYFHGINLNIDIITKMLNTLEFK